MKKIARNVGVALSLTGVLVGMTACPETSPSAPSKGGKHRKVVPAPNPDPAHPPTNRAFPGNVSITFWLEQDNKKTVTAYNVGAGYQSHNCTRSCHWSETAKPGQVVTSTTDYFDLGATGWIHMQVIQNNNGRILCDEDNTDTGRKGGVTCTGEIII